MKGEFMEKKVYLAPEAELVVFYSEEDIATLALDADDDGLGGGTLTPEWSTPDNDNGWL